MSQWVSERRLRLLLSAIAALTLAACGGKRAASNDEGHGVNVGAPVSPGVDSGDGVNVGASVSPGVDSGDRDTPVDATPQFDDSFRCLDSPGLALPPCDELPPPPVIDDSCTIPAIQVVGIEPFSPDGFRVQVHVRCAPIPERLSVHFMAYIAVQDVWDELYATSNLDHLITGVDGAWTFSVPVTHTDETTLDDIQRCAGWFVGLNYGYSPEGTFHALTDRVTEPVTRVVGPVMTAEEIPAAIRCTTMPFGE